MAYPPEEYQNHNQKHLIEVIKNYPLATVISVKDSKPLITHLPLIYSDGKLIGHLDINNPQAKLLKNDAFVTVIFSGPQCYISPSIFTNASLPTWNYVMVHLSGYVKEITDEQKIMQSMIEMTSFLEGAHPHYELAPDNERMAKFIGYVQGFEIKISSWEGKFKLSQDKKTEDMQRAKEELIKNNQENIRSFLDFLFT